MRFWSKSLMARLVGYFLALSVISVFVTASISFGFIRNALTQSIYEQLGAVSTLKEDELNRWVDERRNEITFLSQLPDLRSNLQALSLYANEPAAYKTAHDRLADILNIEKKNQLSFQEIFLLNNVGGKIIISTSPENEGQYRVSDTYYTQGRLGVYVQNIYTSPQTGKPAMTISAPVFDSSGQLVGVLAAHINLENLDSIVLQRAGLGDTGETYLVDRYNNFISAARFGEREFPRGVHTQGIDAALQGIDSYGLYTNYAGVPVIGVYRWFDHHQIAFLAEISQEEAFESAQRLASAIFLTGLALTAFLAFSVYLLARQIARPILAISATASRIASGNLGETAPVLTQDEIGTLAVTFNSMTEQIRTLVGELEQRVAARTRDLERRSLELATIAEVARDITNVHNLDVLLNLAVGLIRDRFGYYQVGIFLVDERGEFAILRAADGAAAATMLEQRYKLKVGEASIVGYVASTGLPRITLDVGLDAVDFRNPLLPETRSEIGLPLRSRNLTIGVLDIQSTEHSAFNQQDIGTFQLLADQLVAAIENAQLSERAENTLKELNAAHQSQTQQAWQKVTQLQGQSALEYDGLQVKPVTHQLPPGVIKQLEGGKAVVMDRLNMEHGGNGHHSANALLVPIMVLNQVIGIIGLEQEDSHHAWTPEEIAVAEAVAARAAIALENARLLQDAQRGAAKERTIGEISAKISGLVNIDNILQTSIQELGRTLPDAEVAIQLNVKQ